MATMTMDFGARAPRTATRVQSRAQSPAPLRLTARGQRVVRVAITVLVAVGAFLVLSLGRGAVVSAMSEAPTAVASHAVVVRGGETLWQIAARELPGLDPREGIARIRTLNGMENAEQLMAGETLAIPTV